MGQGYGRRTIFTPESEVGMNIDTIAEMLNNHVGLSAWQIRRSRSRSSQLYLIGHDTESKRTVDIDRYAITVFVEREAEGRKLLGESECLYTPGDELKTKIEQSAAMAALVANEPFMLPEAGQKYELPDTVDLEIKERSAPGIDRIKDDIFSACRSRFYNTLKIGNTVKEYAVYAFDSLTAQLPPTGRFDVVFSGEALDTLFNWFTVQAGGGTRCQLWSKFEEV